MAWEANEAGSCLQGAQGGRDVGRLSLSFPQVPVCPQGQGFGFSKVSAPANPDSCPHHPTVFTTLCSIGETNEKKCRDSAKTPSPLLSLSPAVRNPEGDRVSRFPKCFSLLKCEGLQGFRLPEGHHTELRARTPWLCPACRQRMHRELQCFHGNGKMLSSRVPAAACRGPHRHPRAACPR